MREHARRMVADGLTRTEIMHEILRSYDEHTPDRDAMRRYVFEVQDASREWVQLVRKYRETGQDRPTQLAVAARYGWATEEPLRRLCRRLGIDRWSDVHARISSESRGSWGFLGPRPKDA